jgi:hypothetical protein
LRNLLILQIILCCVTRKFKLEWYLRNVMVWDGFLPGKTDEFWSIAWFWLRTCCNAKQHSVQLCIIKETCLICVLRYFENLRDLGFSLWWLYIAVCWALMLYVVVEIAPAFWMGFLPSSWWWWGSRLLWSICNLLPDYTASHPKWM